VVKENFSRDLAELLVDDFQKAMAYLDKDHKAQQVGEIKRGGKVYRDLNTPFDLFKPCCTLCTPSTLYSLLHQPGPHHKGAGDGGKPGPPHGGHSGDAQGESEAGPQHLSRRRAPRGREGDEGGLLNKTGYEGVRVGGRHEETTKMFGVSFSRGIERRY